MYGKEVTKVIDVTDYRGFEKGCLNVENENSDVFKTFRVKEFSKNPRKSKLKVNSDIYVI